MKLKMLRKIMIGLITSAAIAVVAAPSEVYARGGHGGFHGGHGGFHGGFRGGAYRGFGYYGYGYPYAYPAYASGCYRNVRVATPYGWGWQRVYVCGGYY
jgi:hypothetical protein